MADHPIRLWRKANKTPLRELAQAAGTSIGHLHDVEIGRSKPSLALAKRLAEATEVPLSEIAEFHQQAAE